eukprot:scaffold120194_cov28-Tisochrysis_lutea.AAC.1
MAVFILFTPGFVRESCPHTSAHLGANGEGGESSRDRRGETGRDLRGKSGREVAGGRGKDTG